MCRPGNGGGGRTGLAYWMDDGIKVSSAATALPRHRWFARIEPSYAALQPFQSRFFYFGQIFCQIFFVVSKFNVMEWGHIRVPGSTPRPPAATCSIVDWLAAVRNPTWPAADGGVGCTCTLHRQLATTPICRLAFSGAARGSGGCATERGGISPPRSNHESMLLDVVFTTANGRRQLEDG